MHIKLFIMFAALPLVVACSGGSSPSTPPGDAGTGDTGVGNTASITLGKKLAADNACASCHGADFAGSTTGIPGYPKRNAPNLTPDNDTGVGGWSDTQLGAALRTGIDDEGGKLCSVMPRFTNFSDPDVTNVVAYLRSLPAVSKAIPESECPSK